MTTGASEYEALVRAQRAELSGALMRHSRRIHWSSERIAAEQERGLRELLAVAIERSPFHRRRLVGLDPSEFRLADLASLPTMSKEDVMANFDEVVTDPRLSLAVVDDHIDSISSDAYLLSSFRAFPTGGSSGRRGVFLYGWDEWVTLLAMANRWLVERSLSSETKEGPTVSIFAGGATHISGAFQDFLHSDATDLHRISAGAPGEEIVAYLNAMQPTRIMTYPSTLKMLLERAASGELTINPSEIHCSGEYLPAALREAVLERYGVTIYDYWGTTEGVYAFSCGLDERMHLPEDLAIIEPVDEAGAPVAYGEPAAKIFITRLYNTTQPLVRYEIADSMTVFDSGCACGSGHRLIGDLRGRLSDAFRYEDGTVLTSLVNPFDPLERNREVVDYQVRQTRTGAHVRVFTERAPDLDALHAELVASLRAAGLREPEITLSVEPESDRLASGKLRRFIPLG